MAHITFIHGIANKPAADKLLNIWRQALAKDDGLDIGAEGVTSSIVYWADVFYESPLPDDPGYENAELSESTDLAVKRSEPEPEISVADANSAKEAEFIASLSAKLNFAAGVDEVVTPPIENQGPQYERIPLPGWLKRRMMKTFLRDVHHYLFKTEFSPRPGDTYQVQDEIRSRVIKALKEGASNPGPHIVVSHSMGTVIAYDCLKRVGDCPSIDGLITIGSPLGVDEVQDALHPEWTRDDGFPHERLKGNWINIYDHLDPVCGLDPQFANDYRQGGRPQVIDINEQNFGRWRHDVSKYLGGQLLRARLGQLLQLV
jgi:hypothetical protein